MKVVTRSLVISAARSPAAARDQKKNFRPGRKKFCRCDQKGEAEPDRGQASLESKLGWTFAFANQRVFIGAGYASVRDASDEKQAAPAYKGGWRQLPLTETGCPLVRESPLRSMVHGVSR
jgi:hypothetical protein